MRIPLARPYIDKKDVRGIREVLESGVLGLGPKSETFEKNFAGFVGTKYACAVSSGTAGLHLAVKTLGLKDGDEVITTPFSFIASSNCLLYERVKPIFVDIERDTFNIDPVKIESAISKKTKAILPVHIFGHPVDMNPVIKIARKYNLKIIEDACESLGARYYKKMTGNLSKVGVFAFYPNKQITTGEGGMIVTNSKPIHEICKSLRNQGRNTNSNWLRHERLGYNYRMDEMSASLGITQLEKIDRMLEKRRNIAHWYSKYLTNQHVKVPIIKSNCTHSWFVYVIRITNGKRDYVMKQLQSSGIQTKPYLPAIHLQPFMKKMFGYKKGDFPITEEIASQTLAIPIYVGIKKSEVKSISNLINHLV